MKQNEKSYVDIEIDKLTNSIENVHSGEVFDTIIVRLFSTNINDIKKGEWVFNWRNELKIPERQVYKLTTSINPQIIQGLISVTDKGDHVFLDLIENAKFNKGKGKVYFGVAGNMVAFACKMAFELNYNGVISFVAKTQLIGHDEQTLGAKLFGGNRMYVDTVNAMTLVNKYFKDFKYGKF